MTMQAKSLDKPDDGRDFPNGSDGWVTVGDLTVGRAEFRPGWRWSNDVRPIVGTTSCEIPHLGYVVTGRMHVEGDDGTTLDLGGGDVFVIPPGHDAWVVGDESCILLDWSEETQNYAKPPE